MLSFWRFTLPASREERPTLDEGNSLTNTTLRLIQADWLIWLPASYRSSVELVRPLCQHALHVLRLGERDEAEAPRAARLVVLHHHTVDHLSPVAEVGEHRVCRTGR